MFLCLFEIVILMETLATLDDSRQSRTTGMRCLLLNDSVNFTIIHVCLWSVAESSSRWSPPDTSPALLRVL